VYETEVGVYSVMVVDVSYYCCYNIILLLLFYVPEYFGDSFARVYFAPECGCLLTPQRQF